MNDITVDKKIGQEKIPLDLNKNIFLDSLS